MRAQTVKPSKLHIVLSLYAFCLFSGAANAQLLFNTPGANGTPLLRQINANTTGNIPLAIGDLPEAGSPTLSNDGRFLAVVSVDAGRPAMTSRNVFSFDSVTNELSKITRFDTTIDPLTGATITHLPKFTAYSPDASVIAVTDFQTSQLQGTQLPGSMTTPITSFYRVSDGMQVGGLVPSFRDALQPGGEGLAWSPIADRLVSPFPNGSTTALFSFDSAGNILNQVTFPNAGTSGTLGNAVTWAEDDIFPAYSPNGQAIAYFRSFDAIALTGQFLPSRVSLRITSSNGDREIISFAEGLRPNGLTWSPDGTQLAFGLGPQVGGGGILLNEADPSRTELHIVNVDGSAPRKFLDAPAFAPEWAPIVSGGGGGSNADLNGDGVVSAEDLSSANGLFSVGDLRVGVNAAGRERFDLSGDGVVNGNDLDQWLGLAATALGRNTPFRRGDANLDGQVAFGDFLALAQNFGSGREWTQGNFDGSLDGVQFPDFLALAQNFGTSAAAATATEPVNVPEPSAAMLLWFAICCLPLTRLRRSTR